MKKSFSIPACLMIALLAMSSVAFGQEYRAVDNPYQEEHAYAMGSELSLLVEVDGLRWNQLTIRPKEGKELVDGKAIPTTMTLEVENPGESTVEVLAAVLLEDEQGRQLANLKCKSFKAGSGKIKEHRQKLKVDGSALRDTRKVWVFLEVMQ